MVKENRIQEYAFAEKHILESKAKSLALERRDSEKRSAACDNPDALGIPPCIKYFKNFNLIIFLKCFKLNLILMFALTILV